MEKYRLSSGRVGWILAGGKTTLKEHGLKNRSTSREVYSTSQDSVCVSVFNEDIKGLFVTFVGNTNFGRLAKSWRIDSTLKSSPWDRGMGPANHLTFSKNNILSMDFFLNQLMGETQINCRAY